MDEWGGCIGALIVIALVIAAIYAIVTGVSLGLAYAGLTILIAIEFFAHGLTVIGISSPTAAWMVLGILAGGIVGLALGFSRAGRRSAVPWVLLCGAVTMVGLLLGSGLTTEVSPRPSHASLGIDLPIEDKLVGSSIGSPTGIQWVHALGDRGAVFSASDSSRIEYPGLVPPEGTLEFWIKVNGGYRYDNFQLKTHQDVAMIFSSDPQGGDVTWPGTTKLFVSRDGTVSYWMGTGKYDKPRAVPTVARNTRFRFTAWHALGVSYGSQGEYIMLDGKVVASSPGLTQSFGQAGNHQKPLDVPTVGETVSHFWAHHRYEGGFDGILAAFRVSARQRDWLLAQGIKGGTSTFAGSTASHATPTSTLATKPEESIETAQSRSGSLLSRLDPSGRLLRRDELEGLTKLDLHILRNLPYAKHGYSFRQREMKDYFSEQPWYHATVPAEQFLPSVLTPVERQNIALISQFQRDRGLE